MYATVLTIVPDEATSLRISAALIESRLAACANRFRVQSTYRWKGEIVESKEVAILLKIRSNDFSKVQAAIKKMHPYEVPCIVKYDISDGLPDYLAWIRESTIRRRPD